MVRQIEWRMAAGAAAMLVAGVSLAGLSVFRFDPVTFAAIRHELVRRLLSIDVAYVSTYVGVVALVMAVETVAQGWSLSSLARVLHPSRSAQTDLWLAAIHILGFGAVVATGVSFGGLWYWQVAVREWFADDWLSGVPAWAWFWAVVILTDFLDYWHHRWIHSVRFLWEAHRYHHAATEFTLLTGNRLHAVEELSRSLFTAVPLALCGTPPMLFLAARWSLTVVELLQHSPLTWTYGWLGRWVLFSPAGHRTHHSIEREHWDRNFGNLFVWWDRLFGTWMDPPSTPPAIGLARSQYNQHGVVNDYLLCLARSCRAAGRSLRPRRARPVVRPERCADPQ